MPPTVIILEGPAGSGKSTARTELKGLPSPMTHEFVSVERPRDYVENRGRVLAQVKDYVNILGAFGNMLEGKDMTILDRWGLSTIVYDALRNKQTLLDAKAVCHFLDAIVGQASSALVEFQERNNDDHFFNEVLLDFYIIVPDEETLAARRLKEFNLSGRQYPFHPAEEIALYQQLVGILGHRLNWPAMRIHKVADHVSMRWQTVCPTAQNPTITAADAIRTTHKFWPIPGTFEIDMSKLELSFDPTDVKTISGRHIYTKKAK